MWVWWTLLAMTPAKYLLLQVAVAGAVAPEDLNMQLLTGEKCRCISLSNYSSNVAEGGAVIDKADATSNRY